MSFIDDLEAAEAAARPSKDVLVLLAGNPHVLRFVQMDPMDWTTVTDRHPMRPGVLVDERYGYNLRAVTREAAPKCGFLVEDDRPQPLQSAESWASLFKSITGAEFARITDAIWSLNEYEPEQAVLAAKKALSGTPKS